MKILIIDVEREIEPLFNQYFKNEIRDQVFQFHYAFSLKNALTHLLEDQQNQIRLILSEISLPGINGFEFIKIIKARYSHISIFTLTAHVEERNYRRALANGTDDFIAKPVNLRLLRQKFVNLKKPCTVFRTANP